MSKPQTRRPSRQLDAEDRVTLRVAQIAALSRMCRVAIEFGSLRDSTMIDAVSAIADLAEEAQNALDDAFERAAA